MPTLDRAVLRRAGIYLVLLVPGVMAVVLAFRAGGYSAAAGSLAATELLLVVALWLIVARDPLAAVSCPLAVAVAALAALAAWTALSMTWSLSPELAFPESARTALYAAALALGGLTAARADRLRILALGVLAAIVALSLIALASRLLPDVLSVAPRTEPERLRYPLSYWNALGLAAAIGLVLAVHFSASRRSPPSLQALSAAAVPPVTATLVATTSAGAAAAAFAGICVYWWAARTDGLASVLAAVAFPAALAVWIVEQAPVPRTRDPDPALLAHAHLAAALLVGCAVMAAILRAALRRRRRSSDRRVLRWSRLLAVCLVVVVASATMATAGVGVRLAYWEVATGMWRAEPLRGEGAGAFAIVWPRDRDRPAHTGDAHSLFVETLGELGLVGCVLLLVAVGAAAVGLVRRARAGDGDRELRCAVLAVACAWALHAGIDWIWEQPAVGLPVIAMVGAVVARPAGDTGAWRRSRPAAGAALTALVAACILGALVTGRLALASADLEASLRAARRGNCEEARERARQSARVRPTSDADLVLASCALRRDPRAALEDVDRALARDPLDWRVHYDRALVLATLGRDPRPEAGAAHGLNLREQTVTVAHTRFASDAPAVWRAEAARTPFVLP